MRSQICDNPGEGCSVGLHVSNFRYSNSWAGNDGRVVLVEVSPADVVSVPTDSDCEKIRVCRYKVIQECERSTPIVRDLVSIKSGSVQTVKPKRDKFGRFSRG